MNSANWAGYDLQFTKREDTELSSSYPFNSQGVNDPSINFKHFFDGENLVQKDLVAWINLSLHHIPHAETCRTRCARPRIRASSVCKAGVQSGSAVVTAVGTGRISRHWLRTEATTLTSTQIPQCLSISLPLLHLLVMPLNYLLGDASRQTVNQVRINYDRGGDVLAED